MFSFIFPGQGSQSVGMGSFLYKNFKTAQLAFEEASEAIKLDLKKLCFEGSEQDLALTENTQPAILAASVATARVLIQDLHIKPKLLAGHSIGEYAALVTASSLSLSDATKAVRIRGQAMQTAVPIGKGGMAAVLGLSDEMVTKLCFYVEKKSGLTPLSAANFNCPGQVVISGNINAIEWLKTQFKAEDFFTDGTKKIRLIPLQVSAPFHCAMMKPAEEKMRDVLSDIKFNNSDVNIVQNYDAHIHTDANELRENLIKQVSAPVLWTESMQIFLKNGHTQCIEAGAGKVLQGLLKKIDSEAFKVFNVNSLEDIKIIEDLLK